jgi:transposase
MERIEMSGKELKRLEVLRQVLDGVVSQKAAAESLGLTDRQVRRLRRRYEAQGTAGLVDRRRGKPSGRRLAPSFKERVMSRLSQCYADFGPTLAAEHLAAEGLNVSKETLRGWMIEAGLWRAARGRRVTLHPPRPRRARLGELVQIDGSPHDWFEGRGKRCTLIAFIDDATSRVMHAHFAPVESTQAYLSALQDYVTRHGRPAALYSDRHSIFTKHDPEDEAPTQFQRALDTLGIAGIQALTPQAKGRVERLFQTLQDRLVKAMRLAGISDIRSANAFLEHYLVEHNARFARSPADPDDAHLPYAGKTEELARYCATHHRRKLSKDLVLSFMRQRYIVCTQGAPRYGLRGANVTVVVYDDGRIELLHGQEVLAFKVFDAAQDVPQPLDDKTLNARVDELIEKRASKKPWRPGPNHPWRQYSEPVTSGTAK